MNYGTGYCARQPLGIPQPQAKGPPGAGGCNNLSHSLLEGLLYFISPLFFIPTRILHVKTHILHVILQVKPYLEAIWSILAPTHPRTLRNGSYLVCGSSLYSYALSYASLYAPYAFCISFLDILMQNNELLSKF